MTLEKKTDGNNVTLVCGGCLDTSAAAAFADALKDVPADGVLTLEFTSLEFIASSGLRVLVAANKRITAAGGKIVLVGLNEVVADVFEVTGLAEDFEIR